MTLRSIGDGVIATDTEGKILLINKVAEELTGWTQEEAIGKPCSEVFLIINEKTRKIPEDPVTMVIRTGLIVGLANNTMLIARDGTERIIADSGAPIKDVEKLLLMVIGEDIELRTTLSEENIVVMADPGQIEQVLVNLATNSRDAMPDGGYLTITTELVELDEEFLKTN